MWRYNCVWIYLLCLVVGCHCSFSEHRHGLNDTMSSNYLTSASDLWVMDLVKYGFVAFVLSVIVLHLCLKYRKKLEMKRTIKEYDDTHYKFEWEL